METREGTKSGPVFSPCGLPLCQNDQNHELLNLASRGEFFLTCNSQRRVYSAGELDDRSNNGGLAPREFRCLLSLSAFSHMQHPLWAAFPPLLFVFQQLVVLPVCGGRCSGNKGCASTVISPTTGLACVLQCFHSSQYINLKADCIFTLLSCYCLARQGKYFCF